MFGAAGWRGRLTFADGRLVDNDAATQVCSIPQRYSHPKASRRGRRLYGPNQEAPTPSASESLEVLRKGSELTTTLMLDGVPTWGVGLIAIALGIQPEGLVHLRLGGGKNRGMGIVTCEIVDGWFAPTLAGVVLNQHSPVDRQVVHEWERSALSAFPGASARRDLITSQYRATGPAG